MREALTAFARAHPDKCVRPHAFARLNESETLRQGDWLIVGSLGEDKAVEHIAHLVCVNTVTEQRRIVTGWPKAYALRNA